MFKFVRVCVAAAACSLALPSWSADYAFDVLYSGGGVASVVAGSTDPRTVTLVDGDTFVWTINALPDHQWTVLSGGEVFPFMALSVTESANRASDFELELRNNGSVVFSKTEAGSVQGLVHMGTNSITLTTGLVFDQWRLHYTLTSAIGITEEEDPLNPGATIQVPTGPAGTTPTTLLPIFGIVDNTTIANSSTTIYAPVPEPESWAMLLVGACALGLRARRRRTAH